MTARSVRAAAAAAVVAAAALSAAEGQEPADGAGERTCRLVLEPTTDSTESVSLEVAPDSYVTHVRGGLRWTCGTAEMVADSAVRYERDGRLEMIRSVDYADSVRTLEADRVTYFEREDRIVARNDVRLTRRATGSRLEGPRVEFLRVSGDEVRRTVATGRPRLWLRRDTAAADTAPPVQIDGDRVVLLGEEEAHVRGDVVIRRRDTEARSDSAVFRPAEETGELHGSPEVTGEAWRLTGRTVRMRFEDDELREVVTEENGHASGDDFELFAPHIRARMEDESIDRLWAYGDGRPVAFSPPYRLSADSLEFSFVEGEIDEVRAVRDADAVEAEREGLEDPRTPIPLTAGDRSWVAADTITLNFARGAGTRPAGGAASGVLAEGIGRDGGGGAPAPGDGAAVAALPPVDSLVDVTGDGADGADGPAAGEAGGAPGAAADGREVETVRAVGGARAYRLLEPDEPGGRPGRHYQRGRAIVIHFEAGEAVRLEGTDAVGVHLDPSDDGPAPAPSDGPAADEGAEDTVPADTPSADSAGRVRDRGGPR